MPTMINKVSHPAHMNLRFIGLAFLKSIATVCLLVILLIIPEAFSQSDSPGEPSHAKQVDQVQLTFPDDVELKAVIDYVATRLNINIIYDEAIAKQRVTIRSPSSIPSSQLLNLLRSTLKFRGLVLIDADRAGWLTIVAQNNLTLENSWTDSRQKYPTDTNQIVTHVLRLQHISAEQFIDLAQPFLTNPGGNLLLLPGGDTIIVTDYMRVVDTLVHLQELVDISNLAQRWKLHRLEHTSVSRIASTLNSLLSATQSTPSSKKTSDVSNPSTQATAIPSLNCFSLSGTEEQIQEAEQFIVALDISSDMETRVYQLKHTGATRASTILQQISQPVQGNTQGLSAWTITADIEANSLVITCPSRMHEKVNEWINSMVDVPSDASPTGIGTRVITIRFARATELAKTLQSVFSGQLAPEFLGIDTGTQQTTQPSSKSPNDSKDNSNTSISANRPVSSLFSSDVEGDSPLVSFTVDVPTNSIICTGPAGTLNQVERLITRLDRHRPQVLIDVTIVSFSRSNAVDLGVEIQYINTQNGQLQDGVLTSFGLLDINPATAAAAATIGPGLNAVLLRSEEVNVMLRALQTKLSGKVVARPRLLIADNETGHLSSLNEQPFTSINSGQTVSTTSFGGYAEAGTEVTLTPHISESDVVHLEYQITSSSFSGSSPDSNVPPPRQSDVIQSRVTIPSGYTLLVGGLTRQNLQESRRQVPLIGDIPIIGDLFKSRNDSESQTVLYVFMRPAIHRQDRFAYLRFLSRQMLQDAEIDSNTPPLTMEFME